ncbi:MAG: hypothetical protein V3V60_13640 [Sphingomonas aquatilis]|uniref:hypothetical protein n=1 Tax=Sphingomonas aquatilis TaxID=93063 RepID=UPI002F3044AF
MTWAAAFALLRRFWPAIPIVILGAALLATRATLADRTATLKAERSAWSVEIDRATEQRAIDEARWAQASASAALTYADRLATREPIILRSTNTVREYAQTDAGRIRCLGADRVRGIDALDAALSPTVPGAARSGDAGVSADPDG